MLKINNTTNIKVLFVPNMSNPISPVIIAKICYILKNKALHLIESSDILAQEKSPGKSQTQIIIESSSQNKFVLNHKNNKIKYNTKSQKNIFFKDLLTQGKALQISNNKNTILDVIIPETPLNINLKTKQNSIKLDLFCDIMNFNSSNNILSLIYKKNLDYDLMQNNLSTITVRSAIDKETA